MDPEYKKTDGLPPKKRDERNVAWKSTPDDQFHSIYGIENLHPTVQKMFPAERFVVTLVGPDF